MADPELMRTLAFYGGLLSVKTGLMSLLTVRQRMKKMVFPNPEDCSSPGLYHGGTVAFTDSDVERVRRAHRNDLENIGLFFVVSHFYLMTDPPAAVATNLIRVFACLRFCHTLIYLNRVPQPGRFLAFI